jgi:hypothetical protein
METLAWLGAYLVGFALLQLYLYKYFMSSTTSDSQPEGTAAGVPDGGAAEHDHVPPDGVDRQDLVRCGECGAYNRSEQMFAYCKECGGRLE